MKRGALVVAVLLLLTIAGWLVWTRATTLVALAVPDQLVGATLVIDRERTVRLDGPYVEFHVSRGPHRFEIRRFEFQPIVVEIDTTGQSEVYPDVSVGQLKRASEPPSAT